MGIAAFRHVIFDLDGTLIDSRADLAAAVNHVLARVGLRTLPFETVCSYIGEGARRLVERALGSENASRIDEGLQLFLEYYSRHLLDRTCPYPGISETVAELEQREAILSVLSNKPEAMSNSILAGLDLARHFAAVVGPESAGARKPDPAGMERVLAMTGTARHETIFVGDSGIDYRTAAAARVAFCGVGWGIRPDELRSLGARIIEQPRELVAVVAHG